MIITGHASATNVRRQQWTNVTMTDSQLREYSDTFNSWLESNLFVSDCINEAETIILGTSIKKKDKDKMCRTIDAMRWEDDPGAISIEENERRKNELVKYLYNALLKFEGYGT